MRRFHVGVRSVLGAIAVVAAMQGHDLAGQVPPASGAGQSTAPLTGTGLVLGRVLDGLSDRPVAGALVELSPPNRQVLTDAQGRFVFSDLPKGTYTITAVKPGYVSGSYGQRRPSGAGWVLPLAEAERVGEVKVPIWKYASISGMVTDEAGEPMIDLPVRVLARTVVAGKRKLTPGVTVKTDDRGVYRIAGLTPGEYVVVAPSTQATAPESVVDLYRQARLSQPGLSGAQLEAVRALTSGGTGTALTLGGSSGAMRIGDLAFQSTAASARAGMSSTVAADGRIFVYPAQYYPAATTAGQAAAISLQSGEERSGINLQLRLAPTARVSGVVTGPDGPLMWSLALVLGSDDLSTDTGLETATSISDAAGRFTFLGVPPGQYVLRSMKAAPAPSRGAPAPAVPPGPTLWAAQPISVGTADIPDLVVTLRTGFRVSGTVAFDDAAQQPAPDVVRRSVATFESVDGRPAAGMTVNRGLVDGSGQFSSYELVPGRYYLRVASPPPGWTLKSAILDGRDISNVPLTVDRAINGVVITFTNRPGELSGRVQNAAGAADVTATVLIFPADSTSWVDYGSNPRRLRVIRADRDGMFQSVGLPGGDYLIAAIPDEAAAGALDARVLQTLAPLATSITLTDGEKRSLSLKTVAVPR